MTKKVTKHTALIRLVYSVIIVLVFAAIILYWHRHHTGSSSSASNTHSQLTIKGTVSQPTQHQPTANTSTPSSGATNAPTSNTPASLPSRSLWTTSASGNITLQQPYANETIQSGDHLSGLANVSNIQFILTDNTVGLIEEGNLNVVNGEFSGTLSFTPHSSSGKLEVYYPNPSNGAEEDIINIDVNFNTST